MQQYVARRLLLAIPTLLGLSISIFILLRIIPGDIVDYQLSLQQAGGITAEERQRILKELGLDRSLPVQYLSWLKDIVTGNFGKSSLFKRSAGGIIKGRIPVSVQLGIMGLVVAVLLGIPAGVISAVFQDRWLDQGLRLFSLLGLSVPSFWLGMIVISMLLLFFKWVPPFLYVSPFEGLRENLSMFVFPALVVGVNSAALVLRMTRSSMLEVLRDDYIRTARAKGLAETTVLVRHAVRNALIPVVTVIGLQVPLMIGSMVVVETVFNLPGASRFMTDGIRGRDYNLVQGIVLLTGVFVVFSNLLTDIVYAWLNPRVRYQ